MSWTSPKRHAKEAESPRAARAESSPPLPSTARLTARGAPHVRLKGRQQADLTASPSLRLPTAAAAVSAAGVIDMYTPSRRGYEQHCDEEQRQTTCAADGMLVDKHREQQLITCRDIINS
eukprot:CAMPEP_0115474414 /NCGR_PEP_ID=MMETSP0271-20121206/54084_1 /TAXON_ID=71861 /ORGANISM="Scrippsiella trochoidea, Strain CCMP3099" /LENGTH=119 /DNA_ID=CAMNT_0002901745 /DNA_START=18 /DNA_END=376 /DNA_ORIENTATION=+